MPSDCAVCGQAAEPLAANGTPPSKPIPYEVDVTALSEGLKSEVQAAEHAFALDAGRALGGQQSAPSPVQAFLSSIVACTQITLQIVAKERGVDLQRIEWRGWGVFDTRKLVGGSDTDPRFQQIKASVTGKVFAGPSQKVLDELAGLPLALFPSAAATTARCPISQSLHPSIHFTLQLAASEA
ncbi:hypothetical protein CHLNCDRAFT_140096 [Chlorella variabilis]|uniref:OsmC-like protein n=1 Tax=Chlorella variabilis TaxID=554065 RepID=E1ZRK3_CHLVA|nr:hypothetical protein CHLNCDRAFT_140096 [Chlorella variabilis]EFN51641.1 hypothetical protein CHLNCDRAFT_140096 [Chlorella variabilis]|eukprot:XP_005843743.1 hypothetical protein CHLNCDRAFT_140096 [Chlorella variabilis]